jgi:protein-glutamine gamma-glutamyltransferase
MTFAQYFKASSYCLIASGFIAIAATGSVDSLSLILFACILTGSWFIDTEKMRRRIATWMLNAVALAYLLFSVVDYLLLSRSFMIALIHLILFSAAVKILTISKDRDYFILYLISFAELLAASTLTVNIVFGMCFLLFLISSVSALILFEMSRSNARLRNHASVQPMVVPQSLRGTPWELFSSFPAGTLCAITLGITLLIMLLAIPVFFLLPRIASGAQKQPSGKTQFISGFSDRVELGRTGMIKLSDAVVMRVKISNSAQEALVDLKWRGLAFDYYDGRAWKRSDLRRDEVVQEGLFYRLENSTQGTNLLFQTFFMEPLSTDVVFAAHKALAISREAGLLQRDGSESLYATRPSTVKLKYSAISDPILPNPQNIKNWENVPANILPIYLRLPPSDPRIADLARQASGKAIGKYAQAQAVERYLRSHYHYSLELEGSPNNKDPLSAFLFDTRKGHCEYFASAMTIMLRCLGIPARLVNGFRAGEYNNIGSNWTVRQHDAHSWVEAYFAPYGWIEFDPTPSEPQRPKSAIIRFVSNLTDAIDLWWWESIVNYDYLKQNRTIENFRELIDAFQQKSANIGGLALEKIRNLKTLMTLGNLTTLGKEIWIMWIPAIAIIVCLLVGKWRKRIFTLLRRLMLRRDICLIAQGFYVDALGLLSEKGINRSYGQTPLEFADSLEKHPAGAHFLALTRMYNAARFGPPDIGLNSSEAETLLRRLRNSLRK